MSYQIYLCDHCLGPIWFPWGEKEHLGTGWPCWRDTEENEVGPVPAPARKKRTARKAKARLRGSTPPGSLEQLTQRAVDLYMKYRRDPKDRRIKRFLARQLDRGRGDVVQRFFGYLAREEKAEQHRDFVDEIVASPAWDRFVH